MFLWWNKKTIKTTNLDVKKKPEIEKKDMTKETNSNDIYFPVGSLVVPGKLKLYDPLILQCHTTYNSYICASNLHFKFKKTDFKLTHYVHQAFQFRFIPVTDVSGDQYVQLESVEYPGLFFSVDSQNKITLTSNLSEVANFSVVNGLYNFWHISLKLVNSNKYLRHQSGFLRVDEKDEGALFLSDATFLPIVPFAKPKLNIILRGHIRNSFLNKDLKDLIDDISCSFDVNIYVHSWNIVQNSLSYRAMSNDYSMIDENVIRNYFGEHISAKIKHVIIDDDNNIELLGDLDGFVGSTRCPVKGFKNMLYGKAKIAEYLYNNTDPNEKVIQFRFDILSNPFPLKKHQIIDFINQNTPLHLSTDGERIKFISNNPVMGIDNIFIASVSDMYKFLYKFYSHFDEINNKYRNIGHQEYMCFYERNNF
jgi:hypothetical protein